MRIREELSPHLAILADIEKAADANAEDGLQHLARFIAGLIRDGAASSELREILEHLKVIDTKLEKIMTDQDQANAFAAQIESDVQRQSVATANILTKISELESANPGVDFTALKQAVLDEDTQTANEEAAVPAPVDTTPPAQGGTQVSPAPGDGSAVPGE
jgi:hypothetical protein